MDEQTPNFETALNSRHEAFACAYASGASGAAAARTAGYSPAGAANRASELLRRTDVADRLAELSAEAASAGIQAADRLLAKLEPVYEKGLEADDTDAVLQVVELQARIIGLVHGGATIRPRAHTAQGSSDTRTGHEDFLELLEREEIARNASA
jgi:phage terminase small subunit